MIQSGDIGFSSNWKKDWSGFLAKCIRFFTRSKISHSFIITDPVYNIESVQEASMLVQVVPFKEHYREDATQTYKVYRIKDQYASQAQKDESLKYCFNEFAGVTYGKLQLIWFVYRWFNEKVLRRDVRKQKNWMADGVICSELVYHYLHNLGPIFQDLLKEFNPDTIQAQDILNIVEANSQIFEMVESKDLV